MCFFLIRNKDDELLEKYDEICEKLKKIIKNKFDNEQMEWKSELK